MKKELALKGVGIFVIFAVVTFVMAQLKEEAWRNPASLPKPNGKDAILLKTEREEGKSLTLRYRMPELLLKEIVQDSLGKRMRVELGNAPLRGKEGEPVLPVIPIYFIIPEGKEIASIIVERDKKVTLPLKYDIEYGRKPVPLLKDSVVKKAVPKEEIYNSDRFFPLNPYEKVTVQEKKGVKIGVVNLNPVVYFPKEKRIESYKEIEVRITFKDSQKISKDNLKVRMNSYEAKKLGVENPEELSNYEKEEKELKKLNKTKQQMLLDPSESYQYVIITSEAIRDATTDVTVRDLVSYRQSKGITATIVTTEEIYANYSGVDDAEKIRNFIRDAYTNWETEYVVLGGDVNIIPARYLYTDGELIASDLYYQCLDGSYNSDGDKYWGEPNDGEDGGDVDLLAEVFVGRISAENAEEMANGVYKILAYEQESDTAEYLRRSCMVGEELGPQFGPGEFGFAHPFMNEIKNGSSAAGYTTAGFKACPLFTVDSLDDYDAYWPVDSIISLINSNKYSILNHLGHANSNYVMKMYIDQADALKNTKYLFALSQGCLPGYFTSDCIAEHLTTSTRNGLFAGVFNYHYGWGAYNDNYENLDAPSQRINRQFWDAYFGEYMYNVGRLNADSHEDNLWDINGDMIRWCVYETNLFGDPFTIIRGQVDGAKIVFNSADLSDIGGGNGDGIVNPGEEIEIALSLKNVGNKIGKGIVATISETDNYVSVVNGVLTFGDINCCGVVKTSANKAKISIAPECPTPYTFPLTIEIVDNEGNSWLETFNITVHTSYKISGQVLTLTGSNAISGAKVTILGPKSGTVTTNNNGEYTFICFEGVYKVHAKAEGYLPADDTLIVNIPPDAENIDFYLGRPELTVEPPNITYTLQVNDSAVVPLKIINSGDKDLLVTPNARSVSVELKAKGTPKITHFDLSKAKKDKRYSDFIEEKKSNLKAQVNLRKFNSYSANRLKVLYLNTILWDNELDTYASGIASLPNVEKLDLLFGYDELPDLNYLLQYDVVVVASNYPWADPEELGNTLADYVDAGGYLCLLVASFANTGDYGLRGRITTSEYLPLEMGGPGNYSSASKFEDHEITKNVQSLECYIPVNTTQLTENGASLGTYNTGYLVGAYNRNKPIVVINVFPYDGAWRGDLVLMTGNCFNWFLYREWLKISEENKQILIPVGSETILNVFLKTVGIDGGLYKGEIKLTHNDPRQTSPLVIPVELNVDGFKSLTVTPDNLNFGSLWLGLKDTLQITLTNSGTQKTVVSKIKIDNDVFSCLNTLPLNVMAGRSVKVNIVYQPKELGFQSGVLTIESDAEDNPLLTVQVQGECTRGPEAYVQPTEMTFNLGPKDEPADQTAVLGNKGGDLLSYRIEIVQKSKPSLGVSKKQILDYKRRERLIYSNYNYRNEFALDRVIVAFKDGKENFANSSLLSRYGGKTRELAIAKVPFKGIRAYKGHKLVLVTFPNNRGRDGVLEIINEFKKDENVAYVEPDYIVKAIGVIPNDPLFGKQYALHNVGQTGGKEDADIDAPEAWDIFTGEKSEVILGIIDTGVDYLNEDLAANMWKNPGEIPDNGIDDDNNGYVDDVYGYDFAYDDNDPMDVFGHGTHCAGIAAAVGNNNIGISGVSWGAKILAAKFLSDDGSGTTSDAIDAIAYATAMGATITSNSWGGGGYSQALYEVIAQSGLFIAAAGNDGSDADVYPMYPAAYDLDNIISVAATDHNDDLAYFSNYGAITVDLGAPGVNVLSCLPGGIYEAWSGTSMATPHVSGCAVLLRTYNPVLSDLEIKEAILKSTDKISSLEGKTVSGGRLNVRKVLETAIPWIKVAPKEPGQVAIGEEKSFTVTVDPKGLLAGTWIAEVRFITDDPFKPIHPITVTANISPCRSLEFDKEMYITDTVWAGRDTVIEVGLVNKCNAPVTVSSAQINNNVFTVIDTIPIIVKPFSVYKMKIRFNPQQRGIYNGVLTVNSDAEDNPILNVSLKGVAVIPPIIVVSPDTIGKTLAYGTVSNSKVTLVNKGEAPFYFKVKKKAVKKSGELGLEDATVFVSQDFGTIRRLNLATGEFIGDPIIYMNGSDFDGLAYDGENLYYSNYTNEIIVIDPEKGEIIDTIVCKTPSGTDGIGVTEDYLVLGNYDYNKVYVCHKETGKLVYEWDAYGFIGGLGCSESRNSVFIYRYGSIEERRIEDGSLINSINSDLIWGLSYSEAANVIIASTSWEVRVIDPATGKVISTLPISYVFAIGADECGTVDWLSSDIKEGVVPSGGSVGGAISFNAIFSTLNKFPGTYEGILQIQHKRSLPPGPFNIKCAMTVLEQKRCSASPSKLEFTETWLGRTDTLSFFLVNSGNAPTTVNTMSSNNNLFTILKEAPVVILPFDSVKVDAGFTPKKTGNFTGKITVLSNADSLPQVTVELKGKAVEPPKITYSPKKIVDVMLPDQENRHTIKLKNTGGAAYKFKVTVEGDDGNVGKARLFGSNWQGIFELDPQSGSIIDTIIFFNSDTSSFYGQIAYDGKYIFVARWGEDFIKIIDPEKKQIIDSIDLSPNGYSYVNDIGVSKSYLFILKYEEKGEGYKVSVYDKKDWKEVYSWNVGWGYEGIANGSVDGTVFIYNYYSQQLELRDIKNGSILKSVSLYEYGYYLTYSQAMKLVIMSNGYDNVLIDPESGEYKGGFYTYDYMQIAADEGTAGGWIKFDVDTGTVPVKGTYNLNLAFNTNRMPAGIYKANIKIEHYKGWQPGPFMVECMLTVLPVKKLSIVPTDVDFGNVWVGRDSTINLTFTNSGNSEVTVYSIVNTNNAFTFTSTPPFNVPPYNSINVSCKFKPQKKGNIKDVAMVVSNAMNNPVLLVKMKGTGINPPSITLNPSQFNVQLPKGIISNENLSIKNSGDGEYSFSISTVEIKDSLKPSDARLFAITYDSIIQLDPQSIKPTGNNIYLPGIYPDALAFDGKYFYMFVPYYEYLQIYRINIKDPTLRDTIFTNVQSVWVGGLGATEDYILALDNSYNRVIFIDKENGKSIKSFNLEGDYYLPAFTTATKRGNFFVFNYYNWTIEERKLEDGSLVKELPIPSKIEYPTGASYSNALNILYVSNYNGKIFALNPDSGNILFSGKAGNNVYVYGLAGDECAFPPEWLSLSPASGVVQGNSEVKVGVTFDASALEVGNYKAAIKIKPTDSVAPGPFVIPCNFSVTEGELAKRK